MLTSLAQSGETVLRQPLNLDIDIDLILGQGSAAAMH